MKVSASFLSRIVERKRSASAKAPPVRAEAYGMAWWGADKGHATTPSDDRSAPGWRDAAALLAAIGCFLARSSTSILDRWRDIS